MSDIDLKKYVPNVHFEQIPICNLVSNQDYQRALSRSHIAKTVENFDLYQINPVKVSRRDGINYVFNGQHTIEIIAAISGSRETPVWCMVYDEMEYLTEANTFANQQKYVRTLTSFDIFNANIEAENDKQLTIKSLVESYRLHISGSVKKDCHICAVGALEYIFDKYGFHVLDRTLRLCVMTWEGDMTSLVGSILKGIAILVVVYGDKIDDATFRDKVGAFSPKEISRMAKDRMLGAKGYAEAMFIAYTKKLKYNNMRIGDIYDVDKIAKKMRLMEKAKQKEEQGEQLTIAPVSEE